MEQQSSLEMIAALSNAPGASGFEDEAVQTARRYAQGYAAIHEDHMRNLYLRREGNTGGKPVVMLDAHTDEVSFMVHYIMPNGTLHFIPLGGWVASNVPAHQVLVRNAQGEYIPGVIASKPPHFMTQEERRMPVDIKDMVIDIGAESAEEVREVYQIQVGAPVVPDARFFYQPQHDVMTGKAFDCRLGCAAVLDTLRELHGEQLAVDVVGALSTQEEMGTRGAAVTANTVKPDVAIVFEGCPADDTFAAPYAIQTRIKHGPYLRHIDARMITHPRFQRFALDLAAGLGIPTQEGVRTGGSTNGAPIHLSGQGVPCIVIGLPVRYIHTHYGLASFADYQNAVQLACALLRRLNAGVIGGF